jgi:hypothetical protein
MNRCAVPQVSKPADPKSKFRSITALSDFWMLGLAILAVVSAAGCVTKATAAAESRAAFLAGQKSAYQSMQAAQTAVVVLGNVKNHEIPWVDGLTLTQALATANYTGAHDPTDIILKRNSVQTEIDPKELLNGQDVSLHPGDVVSVVGE